MKKRLPINDIAAPASAGDVASVIGTVLMVEDEDTLRIPAAKMLRRKGFIVIEACDGSAAVDLFRANEPEIAVVLLDMTLPVMNGPEVFAELRRLRPDVKVILTTAHSRQAALAALAGQQVWDFVRKPYLLNNLVNLVRDALSAKRG